jgi:hypothetical protein
MAVHAAGGAVQVAGAVVLEELSGHDFWLDAYDATAVHMPKRSRPLISVQLSANCISSTLSVILWMNNVALLNIIRITSNFR